MFTQIQQSKPMQRCRMATRTSFAESCGTNLEFADYYLKRGEWGDEIDAFESAGIQAPG